jgi:hypothetical protein
MDRHTKRGSRVTGEMRNRDTVDLTGERRIQDDDLVDLTGEGGIQHDDLVDLTGEGSQPSGSEAAPVRGSNQNSKLEVVDLTQSLPVGSSVATTTICPVCLCSLAEVKESGYYLTSTVCGHVFCEPCLMTAKKKNGRCPVCRKNIPQKNGYHRLFL